MANILVRSGWLGRNDLAWYRNSGDLGDHILRTVAELTNRGHLVRFSGEPRPKQWHPDLELHIERQISLSSVPKICLYCEPFFVQPQNRLLPEPKYRAKFFLDSVSPLGKTGARYFYPRELSPESLPKWQDRGIRVCAIAANKNSVIRSEYSLYNARRELIKKFNHKLGSEFHLYGAGWELEDHPPGILAKIAFRSAMFRRSLLRRRPLVSYLGRCDDKGVVMRQARFTLCVENTQYPGCITEKIIDCFRFGSVPLYLGPPDVSNYFDSRLFVDLRAFKSDDELFRFIFSYDERDYERWCSILEDEISNLRKRHSIDRFAAMLVDAVERELFL